MAKPTFVSYLEKVEELASNVVRNAPQPNPAIDSYRADLAGFLSVAYAAAFEECVKEIVKTFAKRQHILLHRVIEKKFDRINGKIKIEVIRDDYLQQFGEEYSAKFKKIISRIDEEELRKVGASPVSSYANIISWRHAFAHALERQTTIDEVQKAYPLAKRIVHALDEALS